MSLHSSKAGTTLSKGEDASPTGPLNALKHGLHAKTAVLVHLGEKSDAWNEHVDSVFGDLAPCGYVEEEIVANVADILWRLRRVRRYWREATIAQSEALLRASARTALAKWPDASLAESRKAKTAVLAAIPDIDRIRKVNEVEAHLTRMLRSQMKQLDQLNRRHRTDLCVIEQATRKSKNDRRQVTVMTRKRLDDP